jgi:hypothetical protein
MPRPFPFPFNIGTDICSIPRILKILKGVSGRRFVRRVLSEREREEAIGRLDGPLERWRRAIRVGSVLEWKRKELGLGVKELARRRYKGLGLGVELGRMGAKSTITMTEREELRRVLEREVRVEEMTALKRELLEESEREKDGVVDEDFNLKLEKERTDMGMDEKLEESEEVVDEKEEVEGNEDITPVDLKQKRLDDVDIIVRLMEENEKEMAVAEEGLKKAAEFMAGRCVYI